MDVERYIDPEAFRIAAAPLAAPNASLAAFLHAWVVGVQRTKALERCYMGVTREGFALQRDDGPLLLGACSSAAAEAFADALAIEHPALDGVTGGEEASGAFCMRWLLRTGRPYRLRVRMRNHVLTRLTPPGNVPGTVRSAAGEDADWLRSALRAFADEANVPMSDASVARYVRDRLEEGGYRIREVDATRVAFAGFSVAGPDASRIAPVYTLPAFRKQGHAGALVAAVCAELLASRPRVFLVTDLANPTSNALYRRLGFEPLDDTVAFELLDCT